MALTPRRSPAALQGRSCRAVPRHAMPCRALLCTECATVVVVVHTGMYVCTYMWAHMHACMCTYM